MTALWLCGVAFGIGICFTLGCIVGVWIGITISSMWDIFDGM
jgi:hypothetical protein